LQSSVFILSEERYGGTIVEDISRARCRYNLLKLWWFPP
jgi:hypothetical protein